MIAIDLSKQQTLDADKKAIQQINFTEDLDQEATMFFIIEEAKETILYFSQGTVRVLQIYFALMQYKYKMTQYNTLNVKLLNSQLIKLNSGIKNGIEVTLNLLSNVIDDSNDETNFPHKLLLTDRLVSRLRKAFPNNSSANTKLSKTQLSKMIQQAVFLEPFKLSSKVQMGDLLKKLTEI